MEVDCWRIAKSLRFRPLRIPHAVAVMMMELAFHNKDPDRVGDALNIFFFPDLSPSSGSEASLLTQKWDTIFGGGTLTSFAEKILLMKKQKVAPIVGWDESAYQLEDWAVLCTVFLGDNRVHPTTYDMLLLL